MFTISLLVFWLKLFFKKCWFIFLLAFSSKTLKGDQRKVNVSIALSLLFLPVVVLVVCTSVVLSAPLLPLFTLPIFILGFPRPLRTWPDADFPSKSSSMDWIYYEQLTPSLVTELRAHFNSLRRPEAGDYFLGRFQDRLIWVSVLEAGLFYNIVTVKGLELQETSCHTREAESVDEVFNVELDRKAPTLCKNIMHIMELKTMLQLSAYSDAKSVLTGVVDNPEYSDELSRQFPKVLTWVLLKYSKHRRVLGIEDIPKDVKSPKTSLDHFHSSETAMTCITTTTGLSETSRPVTTTSHVVYTSRNERQFSFRKDRITPLDTGCPRDKESDSDDEFGDFGFSDHESSTTEEQDDISFGDTNGNTILHIPGRDSKVLDPPSQWLVNMPFSEADLMSVSRSFSTSWYQIAVNSVCDEKSRYIVQKDLKLAQSYKLLVLNCFHLIEKADAKNIIEVRNGPSHFIDVFRGKLPWSPRLSWLEDHKALKNLAIQAYRFVLSGFLLNLRTFWFSFLNLLLQLLLLFLCIRV